MILNNYNEAKELFLKEDLDGGFKLLEMFENRIQLPYPVNLHWHNRYDMFWYGTSEYGSPMKTITKEDRITVILIFNLSSKHLFTGCGPSFRYIYPVAKAIFDIFPNGEVELTETSILRQ